MSDELFTEAEIKKHLRDEVEAAGGTGKWLRKHKLTHEKYVSHMYANGDAATFPHVLTILGFERVVRYRVIHRAES